jgi:hypothetical protein
MAHMQEPVQSLHDVRMLPLHHLRAAAASGRMPTAPGETTPARHS